MAMITTVLPTFRRPQLLERAIRSVLAQTFTDFELCVYDDASGDNTGPMVLGLAQTDARVKYYCSPSNLGPMANFKLGIDRVTTPFFNILSDDDVLFPHFYERALARLQSCPGAAVFMGLLRHVDLDDRLIAIPMNTWAEGVYSPPHGAFRLLEQADTWTAMMFRREAVRAVGSLDLEVGFEADFDLLLKLALRFPLLMLREPCAAFTIHRGNTTGSASIARLLGGMRRMEAKIAHNEELDPAARERLRRALMRANGDRLCRTMMKALLKDNAPSADDAIHALRINYGMPLRAGVLRLLAAPGPAGRIARTILGTAYELRRKTRIIRFDPAERRTNAAHT